MKKILSIVAIVALFVGVGCQEKPGQNNGNTTFTIEQTEVNATAEGMDVEINYDIKNPQSGAVVLTECKDGWIKNLSTATYGTIKFTVAPNYQKEVRETTISVQYTAVEGKFEIKVSQAASTVDAFTVEVVSKDSTSLLLDITPRRHHHSLYLPHLHQGAYRRLLPHRRLVAHQLRPFGYRQRGVLSRSDPTQLLAEHLTHRQGWR